AGSFFEARFVQGKLQDTKEGKTKEADGTYIECIPDVQIFPNYRFQFPYILKRMWHYAYLNTGLAIHLNEQVIVSKNGLLDLINAEVEGDRLYEPLHYRGPMLEFAFLHTQNYG